MVGPFKTRKRPRNLPLSIFRLGFVDGPATKSTCSRETLGKTLLCRVIVFMVVSVEEKLKS